MLDFGFLVGEYMSDVIDQNHLFLPLCQLESLQLDFEHSCHLVIIKTGSKVGLVSGIQNLWRNVLIVIGDL